MELVDNRENVIIDLYFYCGQKLEKIDKEQKTMPEIIRQWVEILDRLFYGYKIHNIIYKIYNIIYKIYKIIYRII